MSISAAVVKQLRERTGAGMMECKKALVETDGDIDAAIEMMRKAGMAKADKKASRVAREGAIVIALGADRAALAEVNCETDFVSGGDDFKAFANEIAQLVIDVQPDSLETLMTSVMASGSSVEDTRRALIAKIGENVNVRRFETVDSAATLGSYLHGTRIGVVVALDGGDETLARDIAMHVAAINPVCISAEEIPAEHLERERDILTEQARQEGKPDNIVEKMVEGRLRKYLAEVTLLGQPFVKDPDMTVAKLLDGADASVTGFVRFEVGEGIEKEQEDFAAEVMAQVRGN